MTLTEGRKRQIREMGRLTGLPVVRIIQVRIGPLKLGSLKPKQWRHLDEQEIKALKSGQQPARKPSNRKRKNK